MRRNHCSTHRAAAQQKPSTKGGMPGDLEVWRRLRQGQRDDENVRNLTGAVGVVEGKEHRGADVGALHTQRSQHVLQLLALQVRQRLIANPFLPCTRCSCEVSLRSTTGCDHRSALSVPA